MRSNPVRVALFATLIAAGSLVGACNPSGESLSDPREILTRTLAATAGLRTVTVRGEIQVRDQSLPNGRVDGGTLEAQVDLVATEFSGRAVDGRGVEQGRMIYVDDRMFSTSGQGGRWIKTEIPPEAALNPAAFIFAGRAGGAPDFVGIIGQAIQGPALRMALTGVEDCPTGRCYRTTVEIPRDQVWPLLVSLTGIGAMQGMPMQPPQDLELPQVGLSILSDTATLRLVELSGAGSTARVAAQVRIQLTDHDVPVSIEPPPANLVDDMGTFPASEPAVPAPEPEPSP